MKIGILLTDEKSGLELGLIEFDPSGILVLRAFEDGVHVNALNAVVRLFEKNGLDVPIYVKYADFIKEQGVLPVEILEKEANIYADVINRLDPAAQIGGQSYRAAVVRYSL